MLFFQHPHRLQRMRGSCDASWTRHCSLPSWHQLVWACILSWRQRNPISFRWEECFQHCTFSSLRHDFLPYIIVTLKLWWLLGVWFGRHRAELLDLACLLLMSSSPPSVQALMGRGGSVLPFGGCGLTFLLWKLEEILLCLIIIPSGCQVALNALTK